MNIKKKVFFNALITSKYIPSRFLSNADSIPYDYIDASREEYDKLLSTEELTFQFAISDLINTNAGNGLKSYIEVLLCNQINNNFQVGFSSADEWLTKYTEYLNKTGKDFNSYDNYARKLLGIIA